MVKSFLYLLVLSILGYVLYRVVERLWPGNGPIGMLIVVPLIGKTLAPMIYTLVAAIRHEGERSAVEKWHGKLYSYDGHQIRLYLHNGVVWVPEGDLAFILLPAPDPRELRLLGPGYAVIPDQEKAHGYNDTALLRMLSVRLQRRGGTRELTRFKNWLQNEAFPNVKRLPSSATNEIRARF